MISDEHVAYVLIPIVFIVVWYMLLHCPLAYYLLLLEIAILDKLCYTISKSR